MPHNQDFLMAFLFFTFFLTSRGQCISQENVLQTRHFLEKYIVKGSVVAKQIFVGGLRVLLKDDGSRRSRFSGEATTGVPGRLPAIKNLMAPSAWSLSGVCLVAVWCLSGQTDTRQTPVLLESSGRAIWIACQIVFFSFRFSNVFQMFFKRFSIVF